MQLRKHARGERSSRSTDGHVPTGRAIDVTGRRTTVMREEIRVATVSDRGPPSPSCHDTRCCMKQHSRGNRSHGLQECCMRCRTFAKIYKTLLTLHRLHNPCLVVFAQASARGGLKSKNISRTLCYGPSHGFVAARNTKLRSELWLFAKKWNANSDTSQCEFSALL